MRGITLLVFGLFVFVVSEVQADPGIKVGEVPDWNGMKEGLREQADRANGSEDVYLNNVNKAYEKRREYFEKKSQHEQGQATQEEVDEALDQYHKAGERAARFLKDVQRELKRFEDLKQNFINRVDREIQKTEQTLDKARTDQQSLSEDIARKEEELSRETSELGRKGIQRELRRLREKKADAEETIEDATRDLGQLEGHKQEMEGVDVDFLPSRPDPMLYPHGEGEGNEQANLPDSRALAMDQKPIDRPSDTQEQDLVMMPARPLFIISDLKDRKMLDDGSMIVKVPGGSTYKAVPFGNEPPNLNWDSIIGYSDVDQATGKSYYIIRDTTTAFAIRPEASAFAAVDEIRNGVANAAGKGMPADKPDIRGFAMMQDHPVDSGQAHDAYDEYGSDYAVG
ncbi:MAG: hypothetical protein HY447_02820 [Candidatus Omnitrophica bacterium]|nr:hypothetical protein [Candidatus Omnitrophota bacterium]